MKESQQMRKKFRKKRCTAKSESVSGSRTMRTSWKLSSCASKSLCSTGGERIV